MKKNLVLGVCGSIAAYKAPDIVRRLRDRGWTVRVVMTDAAARFITPLTMETVSGNPVCTGMFDRGSWEIAHIGLAEFASGMLIAPASAGIIGRVAGGLCSDLLSCAVAAFPGPVIFAPAMNDNMWKNPVVRGNVERLASLGYRFVGPEEGTLASGKSGVGRLAAVETIVSFVEREVPNG